MEDSNRKEGTNTTAFEIESNHPRKIFVGSKDQENIYWLKRPRKYLLAQKVRKYLLVQKVRKYLLCQKIIKWFKR